MALLLRLLESLPQSVCVWLTVSALVGGTKEMMQPLSDLPTSHLFGGGGAAGSAEAARDVRARVRPTPLEGERTVLWTGRFRCWPARCGQIAPGRPWLGRGWALATGADGHGRVLSQDIGRRESESAREIKRARDVARENAREREMRVEWSLSSLWIRGSDSSVPLVAACHRPHPTGGPPLVTADAGALWRAESPGGLRLPRGANTPMLCSVQPAPMRSRTAGAGARS